MACQIHEGNETVMVCVNCNSPVCDKCIEEIHNGHIFKTFDTVAMTFLDELRASAESPTFTKLEKKFQDLKTMREKEDCQVNKMKEKIRERHDQIVQNVDKASKSAEEKVDHHYGNVFKKIDKVMENASAEIQKVQDFKAEVRRLQTLQNSREIFEQGRKIKVPEVGQLNFPEVYRLVFENPGDELDMEDLYGKIKKMDLTPPATFQSDKVTFSPVLGQSNQTSPESSIDTQDLFWDGPMDENTHVKTYADFSTDASTSMKSLERSPSFKCDIKLVFRHSFKLPNTARAVKPTSEGKCWVKCHDDNVVKLVDTTGAIANEMRCNAPVLDVAVIPLTNQLLVTFTSENTIKQVHVQQDGSDPITSTLIRTGHLKPCFLCVAHNGEIFVILSNKTCWSVESDSTTFLAKYNSTGRELARIQKDCHGKDLFFISDGISTDNTDTVVVINATAQNPVRSHLVMLDNKLNLRVRYIRPGVTVAPDQEIPQQTEKIWISDVVFNQQNLLLVSEFYSRSIQLLDPLCNLLKVLVTGNQHAPPRSLAKLPDGDLWVGLWGGEIQVYKHVCEFTHI